MRSPWLKIVFFSLSLMLFSSFSLSLNAELSKSPSVPYKRIVSLSPVLTEELYQLALGEYLIADTTYCIHPPEAIKKEKIGNLIEINVEKIIFLKPDLVLAIGLSDPSRLEKNDLL